MGNVPLTNRKFALSGRGITLAALTLVILMSIAPQKASAKGGTFHLFSSAAYAATTISEDRRNETGTNRNFFIW
jgi:hypothetical protein